MQVVNKSKHTSMIFFRNKKGCWFCIKWISFFQAFLDLYTVIKLIYIKKIFHLAMQVTKEANLFKVENNYADSLDFMISNYE